MEAALTMERAAPRRPGERRGLHTQAVTLHHRCKPSEAAEFHAECQSVMVHQEDASSEKRLAVLLAHDAIPDGQNVTVMAG